MNASERAYQAMKHQILTGELTPGTWVREEEVGRSVGLSRTPVREALRRLAVEGYVQFEPNRGARVTQISNRELREILELRSILEPFAARLAAERITRAQITELEKLATEMESADLDMSPAAVDAVSVLNTEFHNVVAAATGNSRLIDMRRAMGYVSQLFGTFHNYTPDDLRRSFQHHRELIEAFKRHDGRWAGAVMSAHVLAAQGLVRNR